ncbi:MAG TPA: DUF2384 domain-containing protein [Chromatiales bacterium]|nr:DUF2384 domain-containing protein [Chromatiales bacterium]
MNTTAALAARLCETLTGAPCPGEAGPQQLSALIRQGIPATAWRTLAERYGLSTESLLGICGISKATLARRMRQHKPFNALESDRLYRVAHIAALAEQALGSRERAARWLNTPNQALGGVSPLSLLDTEVGARQVEQILGRIAYGVFS